MAITVYFKKESKRRNSTLQFALNSAQQFSCVLKSATSVDRPTFLLSATSFDYNLAHWDGRYYFIENITSVRDGQWEVSCSLDALATYKTEILNQTLFVAYSADQSLKDDMIADTRIPVKRDYEMSYTENSFIYSYVPIDYAERTYILVVNGKDGVNEFILSKTQLQNMLQNISSWLQGLINNFDTQAADGTPYDFTTVENALESLGKMLNQSGFLGNAYADAARNIISCVGLPFEINAFINTYGTSNTKTIYLGQYNTGMSAHRLAYEPTAYFADDMTIPTLYTDWRRGELVDYMLGLPGVGVVTIPSELTVSATSLYVMLGINFTTGDLTYYVGRKILNNPVFFAQYSGNFAEQIAMGVSQQASLGQIGQSIMQGVTRTASALINPSGNTLFGGVASAPFVGIESAFNVANATQTYSNTTISKASGGTGYGFSRVTLIAIERSLSQSQNLFATTMGYPVQKVISLTGLNGFIQCANAHAAINAEAGAIDTIDSYLNSGFYIE